MENRKGMVYRDKLKAHVVKWYRAHGNNCEYSVWRMIKLVFIHVGLDGADNAAMFNDANRIAPRVLRNYENGGV